jgi:hypothetical protein
MNYLKAGNLSMGDTPSYLYILTNTTTTTTAATTPTGTTVTAACTPDDELLPRNVCAW